jgi:hypothetical protein
MNVERQMVTGAQGLEEWVPVSVLAPQGIAGSHTEWNLCCKETQASSPTLPYAQVILVPVKICREGICPSPLWLQGVHGFMDSCFPKLQERGTVAHLQNWSPPSWH